MLRPFLGLRSSRFACLKQRLAGSMNVDATRLGLFYSIRSVPGVRVIEHLLGSPLRAGET
eukprot:23354-Alexandrium_andersonii.AAC.1